MAMNREEQEAEPQTEPETVEGELEDAIEGAEQAATEAQAADNPEAEAKFKEAAEAYDLGLHLFLGAEYGAVEAFGRSVAADPGCGPWGVRPLRRVEPGLGNTGRLGWRAERAGTATRSPDLARHAPRPRPWQKCNYLGRTAPRHVKVVCEAGRPGYASNRQVRRCLPPSTCPAGSDRRGFF